MVLAAVLLVVACLVASSADLRAGLRRLGRAVVVGPEPRSTPPPPTAPAPPEKWSDVDEAQVRRLLEHPPDDGE